MTFKQDAREAKKLRVPRSTDFSNKKRVVLEDFNGTRISICQI